MNIASLYCFSSYCLLVTRNIGSTKKLRARCSNAWAPQRHTFI